MRMTAALKLILVFAVTAPSVTSIVSVNAASPPAFSLAWSEYPSWSVFGVSHEVGLINGRKGQLGPIEEKWNVDIELKQAEYDPCLAMYGSAQCDAVCMTNMDALNPSLSRPSVAILPTSTSDGADACIVTSDINRIAQLKGKKVYGLAKSVSEYCFARNIELLGGKETDFRFANMDPGAAAIAMQQKQPGYEAIVVWNPFVLETLNNRSDVKVLFDSTSIPNEIIDMVVMAQSSLAKPGGKDFACAVIDTYYAINQRLNNPATRDDTLIAIGEKFSHLDLKSMEKVVRQTKFYGTPSAGLDVLNGDTLKKTMRKVVEFCVTHEITPKAPQLAYGAEKAGENANLRFDASYIRMVAKP